MTSNKPYLFWGLVITLVLAGCGRTTQAVPTIDTSARGTALAETAVAAFGTATPIPSPTATLTPTAVVSAQGTSLETQADGSTLFTDHKAGMQLTFPSGWLAMRLDQKEYYEAFALDVTLANPPITDRLTQIQKNNVDSFRLDAIDIRPGHIVKGVISDISVVFREGDTHTLEEWAKAERQAINPFQGYKFLSSEYQQTTNGMRVLVIEQSWDFVTDATVYYRGVFFSLPSGTVLLTFQTNLDFKDTVLPDFEQVVNMLSAINP